MNGKLRAGEREARKERCAELGLVRMSGMMRIC